LRVSYFCNLFKCYWFSHGVGFYDTGTAGVPPAVSAKREKALDKLRALRRVAGGTPAVPAKTCAVIIQ